MTGFRKGTVEFLEKLENDILDSLTNIEMRHGHNKKDREDLDIIMNRFEMLHNEYASKGVTVKSLVKDRPEDLKLDGES